MKKETLKIQNIPAILWGGKSDSVYIFVHGKMSDKSEALSFAEKAIRKDYQILSFDLPEHGDRTGENYPCTARNGVHDLGIIGEYVRQRWSNISLYSSSLGAYFSLLAYKDFHLEKCLFLSPVLDMERLIRNMMKWFGVSEQALKEKQKMPTPMGETLYWDYYCYVRENPVDKWNAPTAILYGSEDRLVGREIVERFTRRFGCDLTVGDGCEHWFHTEQQLSFLDKWLEKHI